MKSGQKLIVALFTIMLSCLSAFSQTGEVEYVPNGGFEHLVVYEGPINGSWPARYLSNSEYWRQFHLFGVPNPYELVDITTDRIYHYRDATFFYDPVGCSTADLFATYLLQCGPDPNLAPPAMIGPATFSVPENWFGREPHRQPYNVGKYAGLYYRLNGIKKVGEEVVNFIPTTAEEWETELWREYLETELKWPLKPNTTYKLSFWISLGETSTRSIRLEGRLSKEPYHRPENCNDVNDGDGEHSQSLIPVTDYPASDITFTSGNTIPMNGWTQVTQTITTGDAGASGQKYFTIGNFDLNPGSFADPVAPVCGPPYYKAQRSLVILAPRRVYFYVDDASVVEVEVECVCGADLCIYLERELSDAGECCYSVYHCQWLWC